ncbi:MAG: hypothetical protein V4760_06480 [Bdellovibrionota bacterium]
MIRTYWSLCLAVVSFAAASASARNSCDALLAAPTSEGSVCTERGQDGLYLRRYEDGTFLVNPGQERNPAAAAFTWRVNPDVRQRERLNSSIRELIESMKRQVANGVAEASWNVHQRFIIRRLRSLNVVYTDENACSIGYDSSYDPGENKLAMCAMLSYAPSETVLSIVAHELGHLVDPCMYAPIPRSRSLETRRAAQRFGRPPRRTETILNAGVNDCALGRCPEAGSGRHVPRTYSGHPYVNESVCIAAHYPMAPNPGEVVRPATGSKHLGGLEKAQGVASSSKPVQGIPVGEPTSPRPITSTSPVDSTAPACSGQALEGFADQVAASLMEYHLRRVPNAITPGRAEAVTFAFASDHCVSGDRFNPEYPRTSQRSRSYLQAPSIASALGCDAASVNPVCPIAFNGPGGAPPRTESQVRGLASSN